MLRFEVRNVCGLDNISHIHTGHFLRIGGKNAEGKSSLMLAIGMALSGNGNPYGLNKSLMQNYRRNGSANSTAELEVNEGRYLSSVWTADGGVNVNHGEDYKEIPKVALEITAGLRQVADIKEAEWKSIFSGTKIDFQSFAKAIIRDFDRPMPSEADWLGYEAGHNETHKFLQWIKSIHAQIEASGQDEVLATLQDRRRDCKRDWENEASGDGKKESYGKAKSGKWTPMGWQEEWESLSHSDMTAMLADAEDNVLALSGSRAAMEERKKILSEQVGDIDASKKQLEQVIEKRDRIAHEWKSREADMDARIEKLKATAKASKEHIEEIDQKISFLRKELSKLGITGHINCPKCNASLVVKQGDKGLAVGFSSDPANVNHRDKVSELQRSLDNLVFIRENDAQEHEINCREERDAMEARQQFSDMCRKDSEFYSLKSRIASLQIDIGNWEESRRRIADLDRGLGEDTVSDEQMSSAENKRDLYRKMITMRERLDKARAALTQIEKLDCIIDSIETGGVSAELKKAGLSRMRDMVRKIGGILDMECDMSDYNPILGGRPLMFCSESEQWILSFVVQRALATLFSAEVVLVDRFDVLDEARRRKFLDVAHVLTGKNTKVHLVVAGTTTDDEENSGEIDIILKDGQGNDRNKTAKLDGLASPS